MILLALAAALAAMVLMYFYLEQIGGSAPVLVAASDLAPPLRLGPDHIRIENMPLPAIHPYALTSPSAALDRYLLVPLVKGQMILEPQLASPGVEGPVSSRLQPGYVAFFVPITTNRSLGGAVTAGDRVDFLLLAGSRSDGMAAQRVVRGVRVLELRDETGRKFDPDSKSSVAPAGLLVEVLPEDAVLLAHSIEQGSIYVTLGSSMISTAGGD